MKIDLRPSLPAWSLAVVFCLCAVGVQAADNLLITEFMAENDGTVEDEDGDTPDWVEIYNAGTNVVNLGGWYLTDNLGALSKWRFPSTNLPPNSYLLVFASNKDRRIAGQPLHTSFALDNDNGLLALVRPDGATIASSLNGYPQQVGGVSYGVPVTTSVIPLLTNGSPGRLTVPLNAILGTMWTVPGHNDGSWIPVTNGVGFEADAPVSATIVVMADSALEFSGNQDSNGWSYGYWEKDADANGQYGVGEFVPFPRGASTVLSTTNYFNGSKWDWPAPADPPWMELTATGGHPSGESGNPALPIHWIIRRYTSETNGLLRITGTLACQSSGGTCGDGTVGRILVEGVEVYQRVVFGQSVGYSIVVNAQVGTRIDFVIDPGAAANDFCDTTTFTATIRTAGGATPVADTIADWSVSGAQGYKGWFYGNYDRTADPGQVYAASDFRAFPSSNSPHGDANYWNGAQWQWFDGDPPYDTIAQMVMKPSVGFPLSSTNRNEHWVIRRWVSEVSGTLQVDWHLSKQDVSGTGVKGTVFQNGIQRDTYTAGGADFLGQTRTVTLTGVQVGDFIDFAVDPLPGGNINDPIGDVANFNAVIHSAATLSNQFVSDIGLVMTNLNSSAYLRLPFTLADAAGITALNLRLRYDDGVVVWVNGVQAASRNAPEPPAWNSTALSPRNDADAVQYEDIDLSNVRDLLQAGPNILAIQALNAATVDFDLLVRAELNAIRTTVSPGSTAYFTTPSPQSVNAVGITNLGPLLTRVGHVPRDPADDEEMYVTARISPLFAPLGTALLYYRVMWGAETSTPMLDDGLHGDGLPGDGNFGAIIPAAASTNGQMIRYYISAADAQGRVTRNPPYPNASFSSQYHGAVVKNPALTNPLEVLHWFIQTPGAADTPAGVRCSLYFLGEFYDNVLFNIHGQSSQGFLKKSYDIDFNPDHNFLWKVGESRVDDVNMLTTYPDKAQMRNILSYEMYRDSGPRAPHHYVVPVRVQMNSGFHGTWHVVENGDANYLKRIGRDPNGALYKIYDPDAGAVGSAEKKTRRNEGRADLQAMIDATSTLTGTALRQYLFDNVDVSEVVNKMAAYAMTANIDCCHKNYYVYRDSEGDGEWEMLPWDVDLSFGRNWRAACSCYWDEQMFWDNDLFVGANSRLAGSVFNGGTATATRQMYLRRIRTMMDTMLQDTNVPVSERLIEKRVQELSEKLGPDAVLDLARWGTWTTGTTSMVQNASNPAYQNLYQAADILITNYLNPRRVGLFTRSSAVGGSSELPNAQPSNVVIQIGAVLFNPPSGNQNEEYIQLLNTNAIWVDLTGWKLTGAVTHTFQAGVVMPPAGSSNVLYVVPDKKSFRARATAPRGGMGLHVEGPYSGQLSARGETLFLTDTTGRIVTTNLYPGAPSGPQQWLRITEIMYHPSSPPSGSPYEAEDFEYIELRNMGPATLSLAGVHFTNGIEFAFTGSAITSLAPDGHVLVVRNPAAFASRYGANTNVAGAYVGILDNGGENLRLDDAVGEKILDFRYDNDWYPFTDGPGASLVIRDATADWRSWDLAASWRPSAYDLGSPAATDPATNAWLPVLVAEVLSHSDPPLQDAIKLFNPNGISVNIGGWFLSDDLGTPRKYRIPDGTSIPAGSFLTFSEPQFNSTPGTPPSFSFSSLGDEAYVFSGNGTNVTGWVHGHSFGAGQNGVSFGRYTNSQEQVHFVALASTNFAAANALPKVGPVVISEIMYHPPDVPIFGDNTRDEFVELANLSGAGVPLYDPLNPTNTWRLRGGIEFQFPTNTVLAANGHVLLVSFYPSNATVAAEFRARNNVPPTTPLHGPFMGRLDNGSDRVELQKPDAPAAGQVPYVLVERVDYSDASPWPQAADELGGSLQRLLTSAYANDPTNWIGAAPTGGNAFIGGGAPFVTEQPADTSALISLSASFSVTVGGPGPFAYQWQFNSNKLVRPNSTGLNGPMLTLNNVQPADAGHYRVVVLGAGGSVESTSASLDVTIPATLTQQPTNVAIRVPPDPLALANRSVSFRVMATTLNPPLSYRWQFNGTNLPLSLLNHTGTSSNTLTITNVVSEHGGTYRCAVTDAAGTIFSVPAVLSAHISPIIILHPQSQTVFQGEPVTLTIMVSNVSTPPFNYVWRQVSSIILSNGGLSSYSNSIVLTNLAVLPTNMNRFRCDVSSPAATGQGVIGLNAFISVLADFDRDRVWDTWEAQYGFDTNNAADALLDLDGDLMSNRDEFNAGTDPTDPASVLKLKDFLLGAGESSFQFLAISNRTYGVQQSTSLPGAPWTSLTNVSSAPTNRILLITNLPAATAPRYIRIVTPQP